MCPPPAPQGGGGHPRRAVGGWGVNFVRRQTLEGGGYTLAGRWGVGGVNILEDARHWIGLLQYNLSTHPPPLSSHSSSGLCGCNYYLLHEVAGPEEVAGAAPHDEGTTVDVHNDRPLTLQPGCVHIQAAQGRKGTLRKEDAEKDARKVIFDWVFIGETIYRQVDVPPVLAAPGCLFSHRPPVWIYSFLPPPPPKKKGVAVHLLEMGLKGL